VCNLVLKRKGCLCRKEGKEGNLQKDLEKALEKAYVTSLGKWVVLLFCRENLFSTSLSCKLKSIHFIQSLSSQFKIWCLSLYLFIYLFSISNFNHLLNSSNSVPILFSFCRFFQAFFILVNNQYFLCLYIICCNVCALNLYIISIFFVQAFIENNTSIDMCCCLHEISELLYHLFKCLCFKYVYNQYIFCPSFYSAQHFNRSVLLLA